MEESFPQRLARLESQAGLVPPGAWGLDRFEFAVPRVDTVSLNLLRGLSDERLTQVMFTQRKLVTLTWSEICSTDELTINLLDAPD
jgi:hypothetical protein